MNSSTLETQKSSVLILTGMHRSGTSLATALLQSSGLHIGRKQLNKNKYNPKGYFENVDFLNFHQAVLQSQEIVSEGWTLQENLEVEEQYIEQARTIIAQNAISSMWGWKDPRTTLFLNFWAKLLPEAKFLLVYRSPWEVVDSLYRRGDETFDQQPELAVKLWLHYNQKIINFYNQYPSRCILSNISTIVKDPKQYIESINQKFGTRLGTPGEDVYESSLFQSYSQDSHRPTVIDYYFSEAIEMYQELEARSWQPDENLDLSWRDRIKSSPYRAWVFQDWMELRRVESLYKSLQADHQLLTAESEQLKSQLSQTQKELEESQSKLQETERDLDQSKSQLSETEKELNQSQSQLSQTQIELDKSQSQLSQTREELEQSQSQLTETQRVSAQFQTQLSQTQTELTQTQSQLHQTQEELEQSQSQLYQTTTILEQSHSQLHQTEEVLEQLLDNYKQTETRADKVEEELEQSQSQLYQLTTILEESQRQLQKTESLLEQLLDNHKETEEKLAQSELLLNETQIVLDQSQSQLHQTEQVLEQYYSRYKKSQGELQRNLSKLHRTQKELEQSQVQFQQARNELDRLLFLEAIAGRSDESYQRLVWEAWYAYRNNDLAAMVQNLRKSMKQKPFSQTETVLNWLESFAKFSSERGETLNTQALTNSPEWKQLIRQAISKKSVLARKQSVQQPVSF
ncbi:MAG: sulfotransferase [Lyngbya sp.]|nr:sulfotransferase [Lyngbya sp.]